MRKILFDFTSPQAVVGWRAIDDRVMGGVSRSQLRHDAAGHAVFEGVVSLARQGGFASVRSGPGALGCAGAQACTLELRGGEGRPFKLSLFTDDGFDTVSWQAAFRAPAVGSAAGPQPVELPGWTLRRLPLAAFRASWRGREVPGTPPLDPARIRQVGLVIAGRQAGPFALALWRLWLD